MGRFFAPKRVQSRTPGSDGMLDSLAAAAHSTTWLLYSARPENELGERRGVSRMAFDFFYQPERISGLLI